MTLKALLTDAANRLNSDEAALEAQLLLQHVLNVNRAWLIAHQSDALEANIHAAYRALINRRVNGEPIAYILGTREFYGLKLKVTPDTLIPRPDTETLVEAALTVINPSPQPSPARGEGVVTAQDGADSSPSPLRGRGGGERGESLSVLDLGTGSGAIALAIAKHRPQVIITSTDASQAALDVAMENAKSLEIANVRFVLSDWFSTFKDEKFDVIVSNPPYIEQNDVHLTQGDLPWEPISALVAGPKNDSKDGLDDIRVIITQAPQHLNPHGCLLLEHGYNQAESVVALLKSAGFDQIETHKDLGGNSRVTLGVMRV